MQMIIGRDTGAGARAFRVVYAVVAVLSLGYRISDQLRGGELLAFAAFFVLVAAAYGALFVLWDRTVFGRTSPWVGAALMQIPMLAYPLGLGPDSLHNALAAYTVLGVLLSGLSGYGGIEVAVLPALLLRRRPVLYSPFNVLDLAERSLRARPAGALPLRVAAIAAAVFTFVMFWLVPLLLSVPPAHDVLGDSLRLPAPLGALLLVVAGYSLVRARQLRRSEATRVLYRRELAGALVLTLAVPPTMTTAVPDQLFGVIMLVGIVVGVAGAVSALRRRPAAASLPTTAAEPR